MKGSVGSICFIVLSCGSDVVPIGDLCVGGGGVAKYVRAFACPFDCGWRGVGGGCLKRRDTSVAVEVEVEWIRCDGRIYSSKSSTPRGGVVLLEAYCWCSIVEVTGSSDEWC